MLELPEIMCYPSCSWAGLLDPIDLEKYRSLEVKLGDEKTPTF